MLPGSSTGDTFLLAGNNFVFSFSYSGSGFYVGAQTAIAGKPWKTGYVNGVGDVARFTDCVSMAVLPSSDDIVVLDAKNNVLRLINAVSKQVSTLAGAARSGSFADFTDGIGNVSTFSSSGRLAVASAGRVYVIVPPLRLITYPEVVASTLYRPYALGTSDGLLSSPGVASDSGSMTDSFTGSISPSGTFFILSDGGYHTIRRLDLLASRVSTIAGGVQGCGDATGTNAQFNNPRKTLVTSNNSLVYIADVGNLAVRVMDLQTLQVWTLTGTCPPAAKSDMSGGLRISMVVFDMVISSDETFIVSMTDYGILASIRLDTGLVSYLSQNDWSVTLFWQSLAMIPAKAASCRVCGQGTYSSNGALCVPCSAGMLCGVGAGNQTLCPLGYSCADSSSSSMVACALGSFCPAGSQNQTLCPAGYVCVNASLKSVCGRGSFCPAGSVAEIICPEGYYCSNTSVKFSCTPGNLCFVGSVQQTVCPAGYFCRNTSSQTLCELGSFCPAGSLNQSACPLGYYCPSTEERFICPQDDRLGCPAGSTSPVPFANNSFCAPGSGPQGGIRDIVVWLGGYGLQSMVYDRTSDIDVGGAVELIAGTEAKTGNVDGVGGVARFNSVYSAVLLPYSTVLIVADSSNSVLRMVDFKTKNVTTFLGVITVGGVKQNIDGVGSSASVYFPMHILMARNSQLIYVFTMNSIRTVTYPDMVVSTLPGIGLSLLSIKPSISSDGKFFVISDFASNLVHRVDLKSSLVSTVGGSVNGCRNGVGTDVLFDYPSVSVILSNGTRAYIADNFNHGIRILDTGTLAVTSLVGSCPSTPVVETAGYRISLRWVDGMVLSADETYLIVLLTYSYSLSRIDLSSGYVNPITPSGGSFFAGKNLALIPNIPPPCFPCEVGWYSLEGLRCVTCPSGYFCSSVSLAPVACSSGSFCPFGSTQESLCGEGSFCPNASVSFACEAGYVCPLGSVFPEKCALGQYCPANSSSVVFCSSGSFCSDPSTIKACDPGAYCIEGSTSQTPCALGNYCPNTSAELQCPLGAFCPEGSISQSPCPELFYCPDPSRKILCTLGQYCPAKSSSANLCSRGSFCSDPSTANACYLGTYCIEGSTSQTPCALGFNCPNASFQFPCPLGAFCPEGSISQSLCPEAYYCPDSSRKMVCPSGMFCRTGSSAPAVCTLRQHCPAGSASASVCPEGSFCKDPSSIQVCSKGSYCPSGSISDAVCPAGAFCETLTSIHNCSSGSYCPPGSTAETLCRSGYFCPTPAHQLLCPQGAFCVAKSTEPAVCERGSVCDMLGGSVAGVCPAGSYCVAGEAVVCPFHSTSKEGSGSIDDCVCDAGLSLVANTTCDVVVVAAGSPMSPGVIAGIVVGGVVVVGVVVGGVPWVYGELGYSQLKQHT